MKPGTQKIKRRQQRRRRVRAAVFGSLKRPRLSVFRSAQHIYAQLVDDESGKTLAAFSSRNVKEKKRLKKVDIAKKVGEGLAQIAKQKGISMASFDRGGNAYHGRVRAVAEGAREQGLLF